MNRNTKPQTDHTGKEFPSIKAMLDAWGVTVSQYYGRIKLGWTIEQALTGSGPEPSTAVTAPDGQRFPSASAMYRHYHTTEHWVKARLKQGDTLEQALAWRPEGPPRSNKKPCTDHLGQSFPSVSAMTAHWGINITTLRDRMDSGMTLAEALTTPKRRGGVKDDHGRVFPSVEKLCKANGISVETYNRNRSENKPLTYKRKPTGPFTDHTGKEFPSIKAMLNAWGVTKDRWTKGRKRGFSVEQILTGQTQLPNPYAVTGPDGRVFASMSEICREYSTTPATVRYRMKQGDTLEQALLHQPTEIKLASDDQMGHQFRSRSLMAKHYGILPTTLNERLKSGMTLREALTVLHPGTEPVPGIVVLYRIDDIYYAVRNHGSQDIMTWNQIQTMKGEYECNSQPDRNMSDAAATTHTSAKSTKTEVTVISSGSNAMTSASSRSAF